MTVLNCLMLLQALTAQAYYPPLPTTASSTTHSVNCQVYDPKLERTVSYTSLYLFGDREVIQLQQHNGVIAWVWRSGPDYYVNCCTYDPALANPNPGIDTPFQEAPQGPFTSVDQLQVMDGVVAYVAGVSGHSEFRYATYDPAKKAWQTRPWSAPGTTMQNPAIATKDGVVVFLYTSGNHWLWADAYDPKEGMWGFGGAIGNDSPNPYLHLFITNATVTFHTTNNGVDYWDTFDYTIGQGWHMGGTTPPQAYFVARPASGPAPLWVWFTDMSIAGSDFKWDFGDGYYMYSRSPIYVYNSGGRYTASQSVGSGPSKNTFTGTISVGQGGIGSMLLLLLQ
jgi:hypothetical protein